MELTLDQHDRLDKLPEEVRVIGYDQESPLIEHPGGRIARLNREGRLVVVRRHVLREVEDRRFEGWGEVMRND